MSDFEFGFSQEDITPPYGMPLCGYFNARPNRGFYDRLKVKAAVFRSNGSDDSAAAIVSFDVCLFSRDFFDSLEKYLQEENFPLCGKILFSATHTHTGPYTSTVFDGKYVNTDYIESLKRKAVSALKDAYASLAPAELHTVETECTTVAFNRRYVMKNGMILTNPGKLNPEILRPEGEADHRLMVMEIRQDDRPVLIIANICNHTDTIGGDIVSADWPGRMEAEIQSALETGIPVMSIIAPQGNINHFNVATDTDQTCYAEAKRIGKAYASAILGARYALKKQEKTDIRVRSSEFEAPYYQLSDEEYEEAKKIYEENKDAEMEAGRDFTSEDIARGVPFVKKFFAQRALDCRDNPVNKKRVEKQMAVTFGDELAIVSFPAEPFVEIGMEVRKKSPYPITMLAALTMGEIGYVGLPVNYGTAGYETRPSRGLADPSVGQVMIDGALELLK